MTRQVCTFLVADSLFGIEVLRVQEVIRPQPMTRVPLARSEVRGLMNLRGQIVTTLDLRKRLGLPDHHGSGAGVNIVVRTDDGMVSLIVDEVGDVLDVPDDLFEPPPETVVGQARELIVGAYKFPTRLMLSLDLDRVLDNKPVESTGPK
jgi:purine-binding chemotaxis protein CheW